MQKNFSFYSLIIICLIMLTFQSQLFAQVDSKVSVVKTSDKVVIGNGYIQREFSTVGNKLKTTKITNFRTDGAATVFVPRVESEEFVIAPLQPNANAGLKPLSKTNWTITADSWSTSEGPGNGVAEALIDGNVGTHWHSNYGQGTGDQNFPYELVIDLKTTQTFKSFTYTPRQQGANINGNLAGYEIYVSDDSGNFETYKVKGTFKYDGVKPITVNFPAAQSGRYVKIKALSAHNGQRFGGGAEFDLNKEAYVETEDNMPKPYAKTGWTITGNSVTSDENAPYTNLLDGNKSTFWHSRYNNGEGELNPPFYVIVDMKAAKNVKTFAYTARPVGENGIAKDYELYISNDEGNFGTAVKKGTFDLSSGETGYVVLDNVVSGRYLKFVILNAKTNQNKQFGSGAEIDVYGEEVIVPKYAFSTSDMTLANTTILPDGKSVRFDFDTYNYEGIDWTVSMFVEMADGDHFMRKYLEISVPEAQRELAQFDYIDCEYLATNAVDAKWTHPQQGEGVGGMSGYWITLGQPIYVQGMFFGSEFPQTETSIAADGIGHIRYFSGKTMKLLQEQNRLTNDGKFVTWKTVAGAARSTDINVIQSDFFAYINSISTPSNFRLQYNSWYDWMMKIDENNIVTSFWEMEKGFSQYGVRPMDSYVVDDGWNAYGPFTNENTTGFWQFNSKFPNGLKTPSDISHKLASNFGLWLGPRGGYNYNDAFGRFLEQHGNGMYNPASGDVTTNHKKYLEMLQEFFLEQQDKYRINYWKWDGFSTKPNPRISDQFITGGEQGMYYMTEHWERWIDIMKVSRKKSEEQGLDNMWFNLTCYVNPSPWLLQWANSIWIQNSTDIGRVNTGLTRQHDQILSYRDGRYFDFNKERQFQFPFANIYNHDPIYGKTGTNLANAMNDDEFRTYLMMMATRGTAFWELYYSYTMMEEGQKWMINAEVMNWIEENFHILRNSKLLGATPDQKNVYGYSCWDGYEGIVSVRNPSTAVKSISFTLNKNIGVKEGATNLHRVSVLNFKTTVPDDNTSTFNYDQDITVTLQPGEARIWRFSPNADTTPATVETVKSEGTNKVTVKFDERVKIENATFDVDGAAVTGKKLLADMKTVELTLAANVANYTEATVNYTQVEDYSRNMASGSATYTYFPESVVYDVANSASHAQSIKGISDFNISFNLATTEKGVELFKQADDVTVSIDAAGKIKFDVKGLSVTSDAVASDGTEKFISVCREKNGMLKIYVDGVLDKSVYNAQRKNEAINNGEITTSALATNLVVHNKALAYDANFMIANPPVKIKFSDANKTYWYRLQDNNGDKSNKMYVTDDGSYTNRLKYRRAWENDDSELFKFVRKTEGNDELAYIYSKKDETTKISVNPATSNLIQVFNNPNNDTWKIYPSKDPYAYCIQAVNQTGNNLLNSFSNSASGGIIGFWNDDNNGDKGSEWLFEEFVITGVDNVALENNSGIYVQNRHILSKNVDDRLKVFTVNGNLINHKNALENGIYIVQINDGENTVKVIIY